MYSTVFQNNGFEVTAVEDYSKALEVFQDKTFDLALIDCSPPTLDTGMRLARILKSQRPGLKIIAIRGRQPLSYAPSGVDRMVYTPCPSRKILAAVQEVLSPAPAS